MELSKHMEKDTDRYSDPPSTLLPASTMNKSGPNCCIYVPTDILLACDFERNPRHHVILSIIFLYVSVKDQGSKKKTHTQ